MADQARMDHNQRLDIIKRNTQEIIQEKELQELLASKAAPTVYLGTAITGRPHVGYFMWVLKLADFIRAGFTVKLLLADVHGALDGTPWDVLEKRYAYYNAIIPLMFESVGADFSKVEIVRGSEFQLTKEYFYDLLKLSTKSSLHDAKKSASEVVKQEESPKLAGILYPLMQALDEQYLGVDIQYGGVDQRKILVFAREHLPKIGYASRVEIMTPLIPGLVGKKMSASNEKSKIDLIDDEKEVLSKVKGAHCEAGVVEDNGVLAFLKYVIMTLKEDRSEKFIIQRPEKYGGNLEYSSYAEVESDFVSHKLHPLDLKNGVAAEMNHLLAPMRKNRENLLKLSDDAY
jgi:tyrosyl-tRNA synthetase